MSDPFTLSIENGIALVELDNPPVNALDHGLRTGLDEAAKRIGEDHAIRAAVILGRGRSFPAGADIKELDSGVAAPAHPAVFDRIEALEKPVIAAIHGTALGGGAELALACHYRIAVPSAKIGLPEVALGILPGAGGTQRLPRLVGAKEALAMMISGKPVSAEKALEIGLIDAVAQADNLRADAMRMASEMINRNAPLPRTCAREEWTRKDRAKKNLFADFCAANPRAFARTKAPDAILRCVEAAVRLPNAQGVEIEQAEFAGLVDTDEAKALRHLFFAMRATSRIPGIDKKTPVKKIESVGVIGAGTMGGGIAMNFANIGIPVTLVEARAEALDRGLSVIARNYRNTAKKGRLTEAEAERRIEIIRGTLAMEDLSHCDLVIEAVFESMEVKEQVFSQLDAIARPDAILASNTSFLDIDHIAALTKRPEDVVGLHFFSPANVMPLLEVVRGKRTSDVVLATAMQLAGRIRKTPVLARVCDGFIANRLMLPYMIAAQEMLLAGTSMEEIDAAMEGYGFAMGPIALLDLIGLDVVTFPGEMNLTGEMVKAERRGQKLNGGFYDYDEKRRRSPAPAADGIIARVREHRGIAGDSRLSSEEIVTGLLYPVVNEGAKILDEGIALRAGDIDVAAILGYNWPDVTGGPMCWADAQGLARIVAGLEAMGEKPAPLLGRLARDGQSFTR